MSFGDGDLHIENEKLKERVDSLEVTNGKLCAEINRQERRIRQLEQLVRDLCEAWDDDEGGPWVSERLAALGIEVD